METIEKLISELHYHGWEGSRKLDIYEAIFKAAASELLQEGADFEIDKDYLCALIES